MNNLVESVWHRYLHVPYLLHVYRQSSVPEPRATLVFLHGLGNSGATWEGVAADLPHDVNFVIVDLLGFGDSPAPSWAAYNTKTQAAALARTLVSLGITQKIILVGHSMGALVAVEFAKRYHIAVQALLLCSPPLYMSRNNDKKKGLLERDELMRRLFELTTRDPSNILKMSKMAIKAGLKSPDYDITKLNADTYRAALQGSIVNQTAMQDIVKLKQPIRIMYGTLDLFVIGKNIRSVAKQSPNIAVTRFIGPHEIIGKYVGHITNAITRILVEVE